MLLDRGKARRTLLGILYNESLGRSHDETRWRTPHFMSICVLVLVAQTGPGQKVRRANSIRRCICRQISADGVV